MTAILAIAIVVIAAIALPPLIRRDAQHQHWTDPEEGHYWAHRTFWLGGILALPFYLWARHTRR